MPILQQWTAINQNVFTGVKIDYKKELQLTFDDYADVYDGTGSTSRNSWVLLHRSAYVDPSEHAWLQHGWL